MMIESAFNQARSLFRPPGVESTRAVEPNSDSDGDHDSRADAAQKARGHHDNDGGKSQRADAGPHAGHNVDISV